MQVAIKKMKNEDNMGPGEVKRLKERKQLEDSNRTMLDGAEIFADKFGDLKSGETAAASSSDRQ
eukprot:405069-Pyramimonas_sp.AAC.1